MFIGVTYETQRTFKWVKKLTDASATGIGSVKLTQYSKPDSPSTNTIDDKSNYSRVNVLYELDS